MNVLALYTASSETCAAAEGSSGSFLIVAEGKGQQSERLLPLMEEAACGAGFSLKETDLVTVAEGPGSFAGLRLGFSAAKAIQLSAGCPFIPVPTFESWAHSLSGCIAPLFCVMDAKKKRFYGQFFASGKPLSGIMDMTAEAAALKICSILYGSEKRESYFNAITLTEGWGRALCAESSFVAAFEDLIPARQRPVIQFAPVHCGGIFSMMALAKEKLAGGKALKGSFDPYSIGPVYIRKSDAEESARC